MAPGGGLAGRALIAGIVLAVGLALGGSGTLGGDPVVYAIQARSGDLWSRPVHLGYLALANVLAPLAGDALLRWLDAVSAVAAAAIVLLVGRSTTSAVAAAAVVLPLAPFAEVDLVWVALLVGAPHAPPAAAAALVALAVAVSPVALLALPWVVATARDARPLLGALLAVAVLTVATGGAWWTGDRGVLTAAVWMPGRSLEGWAWALPWLCLPLYRGPAGPLLATLPLCLAPPDVPGWLVPGLALAREVRGAPPLAVAQAAVAAVALAATTAGVRAEDRLLRRVAAELGAGDGVVARWSDGVRISAFATGDPYALTWRPADRPVRDQAARWCADPPHRVAVVADGAVRWEPAAPWNARFGCTRDTRSP